jgi:hypothetical protein
MPPIIAFDFDAAVTAPFRMQPGLRRIAAGATQLTPLQPGSRHQREKLAVLGAFAAHALAAQPGFDATPALHALAQQAAAEHPMHFAWELSRCLRGLPAGWRLAGLLSLALAEDFAIVDGRAATIPWIAACLPSHWAPEAKVGRHFAEVHAPVADNTTLLAAGEHLLRLVCGNERWERFVWNVTHEPRLNQHPALAGTTPWPADAFAATDNPRAWLRSERQTFIALPALTQAVFTIAVDTTPIAQAITTPAHARKLHDAVASMSDAVIAYRRLGPVRAPLLAWLEARCE